MYQKRDRIWIHCKNLQSLQFLSSHKELNIFWHQNDDFVLTRSNHIWTFPKKELSSISIDVMPDDIEASIESCPFAICTDYSRYALDLVRRRQKS